MIPPFRATYNRLSRTLLARPARVYYYTWGDLTINPANPNHHYANTATWEAVADPTAALHEVEAIYRSHNITPRIRLTEYSTPSLATFLREQNYQPMEEQPTTARLMRWTHITTPLPTLPTEVEIRTATLADLESLLHIEFSEDVQGEWSRIYLDNNLRSPRTTYFIAEVAGQPAATLALGENTKLGLIDDVATLPDYRGRGLAQALLQYAQHHATHDLMLEVVADNAQRLYERAGFQVEGEITESRWIPC